MRIATGLVCISALLLASCASIGPTTVMQDRFDYVNALSDSAKRQMLLNLLKVRYGEAPVFMDVASVIGSYTLEASLIGTGSYAIPSPGYRSGDQIASLEAQGTYSDKPTITYQPLAGEKFARSLMASIPVSGILLLIQSGYPADLVLRICVSTINGLQNSYGGSGSPRPGSPKFRELLSALRQAQEAGVSGLRMRSEGGAQGVVMYIRQTREQAAAASSHRIRRLLGLNPNKLEFSVVAGPYAENDSEIAVQTRSILQVMVDVASYIDVSTADIVERRVYLPQRTPEQEQMFPALVTVRQSYSAPIDAFVTVKYRDQWFWIEDNDPKSKLIFSFLLLLFSLTETPQGQQTPVVTIPAR
jgi:hypothetical protein